MFISVPLFIDDSYIACISHHSYQSGFAIASSMFAILLSRVPGLQLWCVVFGTHRAGKKLGSLSSFMVLDLLLGLNKN